MIKRNRILLAVIAVAAAVFFGVPTLKEGTSGECDALSARVIVPKFSADQTDKDAGGLMSLFAGTLTTAMVTLRYPNIPSGISCAALYWRTLVDPDFARQLQQ
jgi:hypothetical protein